jgi:hypothetical protein
MYIQLTYQTGYNPNVVAEASHFPRFTHILPEYYDLRSREEKERGYYSVPNITLYFYVTLTRISILR